jgi:pimeloyl-ACP methyl ester carboxylesterase
MHDILYLHGFGDTHPQACRIVEALRRQGQDLRIHAPCYHPSGRIDATRIGRTLEQCLGMLDRLQLVKVHLVGYSFGGLLAAILASQHPDRIVNLLLLAPAIDNFIRNYAGRGSHEWPMPREYVEELQSYPARPRIVRPTTLVHGMLDHDRAGSAPWRIQQWAAEQPFQHVYFLEGVDHSLTGWLAAPVSDSRPDRFPSFSHVLQQWLEQCPGLAHG